MPTAGRSVTRIQDQDDFGGAPGAPTDTYSVTWDNGAGQFDLTEVSATVITVAVRDTLLATSPAAAQLGFASDTLHLYVWDLTNWHRLDLPYYTDSSDPDMGHEEDAPRTGYGVDYITNKTLHNIAVKGHPSAAVNGSFRTDITQDPDTLEIYLRDAWQTLIYDLSVEDGDFRHAPIGESIYVWRGNSVLLGVNGRPIVNEYNVSMGAYPPPSVLNGGTF